MRNLFFYLVFACTSPAFAAAPGDFFFDPHASVGFNAAQGTHFTLGLDLGMYFTENITAGVGGYFSAGEHPGDDREIGGGPFVGYVYPVTSFLIAQLREQINYVDLFDPIETETPTGIEWSHTRETGVASVTTAGVHIFFTPNFVLSAGYRLVVGLTNDKLDDGRSGTFLGLSFGI